jgi:mono/diheme cytochrome c family protein
MKRLRVAILLAAAIGYISCQGTPLTVYAASDTSPSTHSGAQSYADHCAICHGEQREGILPAFPPLLDINRQMTDQKITVLIHSGKGRMPAFPNLQNEELTALLHYLATDDLSATTASAAGKGASSLAQVGATIFQRNCAFCHGRDAEGGETGPDLTRSKLALADVNGDKIGEVVRDGRPEKKMPAFNFSGQEVQSLAAFVHLQEKNATAHPGGRRGVDVADLQTGNIQKGKQYFNGTGGCAKCHSPTGDLAGIATRYAGLQLEERMLYPRDAKDHVTVTLPTGQTISGAVAYLDEFTVGLRDASGTYHSWPVDTVKYAVDAPANAHVELFTKYTDADIHNLMAYLQTLR